MDQLLFLQGRDIPRCRCHSRVSLELVEVELISLSLPPLSPLFHPLLLPVPSLVTVIQTQRPRFWWCRVRTMQSAFGSRFSLDDDGWVRSSLPYLGSTGSYFSPMAFSGCFLPPPSLYPLRRQDDPYDTASFILDFLIPRTIQQRRKKKMPWLFSCLGYHTLEISMHYVCHPCLSPLPLLPCHTLSRVSFSWWWIYRMLISSIQTF